MSTLCEFQHDCVVKAESFYDMTFSFSLLYLLHWTYGIKVTRDAFVYQTTRCQRVNILMSYMHKDSYFYQDNLCYRPHEDQKAL